MNLQIHAGETLALVGPSGAGKSTLLKVLNRLYDPDAGCVRLDGRDIRSFDVQWLRTQFGVVAQVPALFDMSITDNVAFGTLEATPSAEAIEAALEASGASSLSAGCPMARTRASAKGHRLAGSASASGGAGARARACGVALGRGDIKPRQLHRAAGPRRLAKHKGGARR